MKKLLTSLAILTWIATAAPVLAEEAAHEGAAADKHHEELGEPPYGPDNAELFTWLTPIVPAATQDALRQKIQAVSPATYIDKKPFVAEGQLTPMLMAGIAFLLVLLGAWLTRRQLAASEDAGVLPARKFGVFFLYEAVIGAVWNLMKGMMGAEEARRHFPIVGTLAFYIFTMNVLALIPGGAPATANLNTNIVMGLTVF